MSVRLSVAVMAHPDRAARAAVLASSLRAVLVTDHERAGVWPTARRAWNVRSVERATHHLVIQDDAEPCRDLLEALHVAFDTMPDRVVMPFTTSRFVPDALALGASWATVSYATHMVACAMPVQMVEWWLRWVHYSVPATMKGVGDAGRLSLWLHTHRRLCWYPAPCLVQHARVPSLIGHGRQVAERCLGPEESALEVWNPRSVVAMDYTGSALAGRLSALRKAARL